MANSELEDLDIRLAALTARVAELETARGASATLARSMLPYVRFLSIFLCLAAAGALVANLLLREGHSLVSASLQGLIYTSLLTSVTLSLLALVLRGPRNSAT